MIQTDKKETQLKREQEGGETSREKHNKHWGHDFLFIRGLSHAK